MTRRGAPKNSGWRIKGVRIGSIGNLSIEEVSKVRQKSRSQCERECVCVSLRAAGREKALCEMLFTTALLALVTPGRAQCTVLCLSCCEGETSRRSLQKRTWREKCVKNGRLCEKRNFLSLSDWRNHLNGRQEGKERGDNKKKCTEILFLLLLHHLPSLILFQEVRHE